jgi:hypothetical protein
MQECGMRSADYLKKADLLFKTYNYMVRIFLS